MHPYSGNTGLDYQIIHNTVILMQSVYLGHSVNEVQEIRARQIEMCKSVEHSHLLSNVSFNRERFTLQLVWP